MITPVESFHPMADGRRVRVLTWAVPGATQSVQMIHGLSEHIGRYHNLAHALNEAGYTAFGHDHMGHGRSDGPRGVLPAFQSWVDDLHEVRSLAPELTALSEPPLWVGHSMGGLILIRYLQQRPTDAAGAVISAPWLGTAVKVPLHKWILAKILWLVSPDRVIRNDYDVSLLTADVDEQARYEQDPLIHHVISPGLFFRVQEAQEKALAEGLPEGLRVLVLIPQADGVTDATISGPWADRAGPNVEVLRLAEVRHEPFNDVKRNEILSGLVEWLNALRA